MSIKCMTKVWESSKCKGSKLLLLLAIADFASDDGLAFPSIKTLAAKIRMSERQTKRLINELCEGGELYVKDRGHIGRSHQYLVVSGMSQERIKELIDEKLGGSENVRGDKLSGGTPASSGDDTTMSPGGDKAMAQRGDKAASPEPSLSVSEPSLTVKRDAGASSSPLPPHQACFQALADVCGYDVSLLTDKQRGQLNSESARLRKKGSATAEIIAEFGTYWTERDWRGKQGDFPLPHQVREEWKRFQHWRNQHAPAPPPSEREGGWSMTKEEFQAERRKRLAAKKERLRQEQEALAARKG